MTGFCQQDIVESENLNMASPDEYIESREEEDEEKKEENLDSEGDYSSEDDYFAVEVESEAERESRYSSDESDMACLELFGPEEPQNSG